MSGQIQNPYENFIALSRYARWISEENRRETWGETVDRYFTFMLNHLFENYSYEPDSKLIEGAIRDLTFITGQKPSVSKATKSIANFKLRENQPIGAHVTMRGDRMWEFLDRLLSVGLPRIRDFRGLSPKQFDSTNCCRSCS